MVFQGRKRERGSPRLKEEIDDWSKECSVTLRNVPYKVTDEELKELLKNEVGEVINVLFLKDDNDKPTGVAYVTFETSELAELAKSKLDRYPVNDRELDVKEASYIENFRNKRKRDRSPHKKEKDIDDLHKESSITITNVPYNVRWEFLRDLFVKEVGEVIYVKLFKDDDDRPTGVGYVTFDTPELAELAKTRLDRYPINDRELVIKDASYIEKFKTNRSMHKRLKVDDKQDLRRRLQPINIGKFGDCKNLYGLSPQFLESLGIDPSEELHCRVFIKNLDYGLDENKLRNVFQVAGRVVYVKLLRDHQDGKSSGLALVEYTHPVEAVQAISMLDGQMLFDRKLLVHLDRSLRDECYVYSPDRLPEGLKSVGMGLGPNGMPLMDVEHNLPKMFQQSSSVSPVGALGSIPPPQNPAFNATALDALGKSIIANQQTSTNAVTAALGVLQAVPGFSTALNNLAATNMLNANNINLAAPQIPVQPQISLQPQISMQPQIPVQTQPQIPVQTQLQVQPSVNMDTNVSSAVSLSNLFQSIQGPLSCQNSSEKLKQEAMLQASQAHILNQAGSFNQGDRSSAFNSIGLANYSQTSPTLADTVVVRNLPDETSSQILKDGFNQCGDIKYCEIKAPGTGVIRFDGAKAAQIAIARMNNVDIAGKNLIVEYL